MHHITKWKVANYKFNLAITFESKSNMFQNYLYSERLLRTAENCSLLQGPQLQWFYQTWEQPGGLWTYESPFISLLLSLQAAEKRKEAPLENGNNNF